jgi:hypothetical protein
MRPGRLASVRPGISALLLVLLLRVRNDSLAARAALCRSCADGNEDQTVITGANVVHLVGGHGDELPGPHAHRLTVNDDGASAVDDGIHVLGCVVDVVVAYGLPVGWKLNLIEPECSNPKCLPDALVVRTCSWMQTGAGFSEAAWTVL